jgi:hypothetical protein
MKAWSHRLVAYSNRIASGQGTGTSLLDPADEPTIPTVRQEENT